MNKEMFLSELENKMRGCDDIDIKAALDYYLEMIEDRMEDGMSEEEAVASIGNVDEMLMEVKKFLPSVKEERKVNDFFDSVVIEDSSANIRLLTSKDNSAYVECMDNESVEYEIYCEGKTLFVKRKDVEKWFKRLMSFTFIKTEDLLVYLPKKTYERLEIRTRSGEIEVLDHQINNTEIKNYAGSVKLGCLEGNISLNMLSGDLQIGGGNFGIIEAKLTAGDVKISKGSARELRIDCTSGDVDISSFYADEIKVKSVAGDIDLDEVDAKNYTLESISGDIKGRILTRKRTNAKSTMGDVRVVSDMSADGVMNVKSVAGDIRIKVR